MPCDEFLRTSEKAFAAPETWEVSFPVSGAGGQHTEVLENFAAAVLHGKPLLAPAEEGIHSVELANAMLLSSFRDGPAMLPMDGAEYEVLLKKRVKESTFVKQVKKAETADFENSF